MKTDRSLIGLIVSVCIVLIVATLVGLFTGADQNQKTYLHTQTAESAEITRVNGAEYTLVLKDVSPTVSRFTDRPSRKAETLALGNFLAMWKEFFQDNPPNAALVFSQPEKAGQDTAVVTLRDPSYDESARTLTYQVTDIEAEGEGQWTDTPLAALPAKTGKVSLFIDEVVGDVDQYVVPHITSIEPSTLYKKDTRDDNRFKIHGSGFIKDRAKERNSFVYNKIPDNDWLPMKYSYVIDEHTILCVFGPTEMWIQPPWDMPLQVRNRISSERSNVEVLKLLP